MNASPAVALAATSRLSAIMVFAGVAGVVVAARLLALPLIPVGLHFDEAQYWAWSRALDWGYYTKPPMIAWAIWATTAWLGDAEWAVRFAAPIAHGVTAACIFALARTLYGAWAGVWAGLVWLAAPAVWFSSALISTDALLLPFWALALTFAHRLMVCGAWIWAALLGAAIGMGLLAKYAMLYFPLCMALAAVWIAPWRAALGGGRVVLIALVALAIAAPNLIWNAQHGFATVNHTVDNANLSGTLFNFDELLEFAFSQAFIIGPVMFVALCPIIWRALKTPSRDEAFLLAFALPPLITVTALAFITRAHANWAIVSYVAATVLIVGGLWRSHPTRLWLAAGLALNIVIGGALVAAIVSPDFSSRFRGVRDARGWEEMAQQVAAAASAQAPLTAIMVDDRAAYYELNYYWTRAGGTGAPAPLRIWLLHDRPRNGAEASAPMQASMGARTLIVHVREDYRDLIASDFRQMRSLGPISSPLGGARARVLQLSIGEGFEPAQRARG